MTYRLRSVRDDDWQAILAVADAAVPWAAASNRTWLANRQAFDAARGWRRHYVAIDGNDHVVAYGAIEGTRGDVRVRLFIVAAAQHLADAGEALDALLRQDAVAAGCTVMWMREEAADAGLLSFATARGFAEVQRFDHAGIEMVVLERATDLPAPCCDAQTKTD